VAGWCELTVPNQSKPQWRLTRDIYRDGALHHLVTHFGPLTIIRYPTTP
jgi:hypothetical protein